MTDYEQFRDFATESQLRYIDSLKEQGSQAKAAKALGINKRTLEKGLKALKGSAARRGYNPDSGMNSPVPDGYFVPKYSTNYDGDGNIRQQWVSAEVDKERHLQIINESYQALAETLPKIKPVKLTGKHDSDLLNCYFLADCHLGMLAYALETGGANYNISIAEETIFNSFSDMIARSPKSERCQINILGDWLHFDSILPVTPKSRHVLDADSRYSKVVKVSIRLLKSIVALALQHHKHVDVSISEGNHDESSSMWMREAFASMYEDEKRVSVETSPSVYTCLRFGKCMVMSHHGHISSKPSKLTEIAAAQFYDTWGKTRYRYIHSGHKHHIQETENGGARVLQHQTLAPRDAYSSRGGWFSENGAMVITYSKNYG